MPQILDLNHVALAVSDVPRSIRFYEEIVGLTLKPRPDFDFEGAWFALGETRELHLIEGLDTPVHEHPRGSHFAMEIADYEACHAHLKSVGAKIVNLNLRPDGARQIFIEDPDQHIVEFCFIPPELRA
ncbi:MAG: glyoxalase [Verrucomicrobiales bacterium]|nr:glyoxalase [Verrucomicrobiales bacterium]